ncbi:MAG TPA: T9SS type B sorting domain-containing protein [Puia sp.]|nr:T9SS type B sorting domain-containing protein [Puia sp.]
MSRSIQSLLPFAFFLIFAKNEIQAQAAAGKPGVTGSYFIENKGQIKDQNGKMNQEVKFLLAGQKGMNVQLLSNGFSYDSYFRRRARTSKFLHGQTPGYTEKVRYSPDTLEFHRVDITFIGANVSPQIVTDGSRPFQYQYTRGTLKGPESIAASVYQKVIYKDLYPFIDLVFEGSSSDTASDLPEYYFIIRPGGDASAIHWKYGGALSTALGKQHIRIAIKHGIIQEHIPFSWQDSIGDITAKHPARAERLTVNYKSEGKDMFGFSVPHYDHKKALVIDPTPDLIWGTYYGGPEVDWGYCVSRDAAGNAVFGGGTDSYSNIATSGQHQVTINGYADAMLGKFSPSGDLLWATYYGGSDADNIYGIACDNNSNIIAYGITFSNDGIATPGAFKVTRTAFAGCTNAFIAKFDPNGVLTWATYFGGEWAEQATAVAVDHNNDIVITGGTSSMTGIASPGAFQAAYTGGTNEQQLGTEDIYLAKFSSSGVRIWSTYYGGAGFDRADGVSIDPDNNIVITGNSYSSNMSTPGTFQPNIDVPNTQSGFVSKFSSSGSLIWGSYFGKGGYPRAGGLGYAVAVDKSGNIYVGGETCCTDNISTTGALQETIGGANQFGDGFLMKFDKNGGRQWGTYCGGPATDAVYAVATDENDGIWITGMMGSPTNVVTSGSYQPTMAGTGAVFVTKFNSAGIRQYGTYYGTTQPGNYSGQGMGIVSDGLGNVYVVGETSAPRGIATCGAVQPQPSVFGDAFIAKFGVSSQPIVPTISISDNQQGTICPGTAVVFSADAQGLGNAATYQWLLNGHPQPGNSSTITLSGLAEGDQVECTLNINSACAVGSYQSNVLTLHIDPGMPPAVSISTPSTTICPSVTSTFTAQGLNEGGNPAYQWSINGVNTGENSPVFSTSTLNTGDIVSCSLIHHGSCIRDSVALSNQIVLSVIPKPALSISIAASLPSVCSGEPVELSATTSGSSNLTYQWELNGQAVGTNSSVFSSDRLQNGDIIDCQLNITDGVCPFPPTLSNSIIEQVNPLPEISITGDSIIAKGQNSQLNASIVPMPRSFDWTPDSTLNNSTILDPLAAPHETTTYTLRAVSDKGCTAEKAFTVEVIPRIVIPNAFTPNNDGNNDVFRAIYGSDISHIRLSVFDRWGSLLFVDNGTHKGWDGFYGGKMQSAGTYAWMFQYTDVTGKIIVLKGTVTLIR